METQTDNKLNYLDITIEIKDLQFTVDIYRKPTTTDLIIHNDSCHPSEYKHSAIRYMINKMNIYHIPPDKKHKETQIKDTILRNNGSSSPAFMHHKKKSYKQDNNYDIKTKMGNIHIYWQPDKSYYKII
jgi:hypothetical protein